MKPNYEQRTFDKEERKNNLQIVVAPKNRLEGNALPISQQAYIYRIDLEADKTIELKQRTANGGWYIFVVDGNLQVAGEDLGSRDAIGVYDTEEVSISARSFSELIIIEVPMK